MNFKSTIQTTFEKGTELGLFKTSLRKLSESYEIVESVFGIVGEKPSELMGGFIELDKEYNSIDEALDHVYENTQGVYVVSPEQVITGKIRQTLSQCESTANVLDISTMKMVGRE